jgi:hypothetical protein
MNTEISTFFKTCNLIVKEDLEPNSVTLMKVQFRPQENESSKKIIWKAGKILENVNLKNEKQTLTLLELDPDSSLIKLQLCSTIGQICRTLSFAIRDYKLGKPSGHYIDSV